MNNDISPEERLLSVIKGKRDIPESGTPKSGIEDIKSAPRAPWKRIDDYISAVLKNDFLKKSILDARALKAFNKYAVIIAALIAGYLILDIILVSPSRKAASLFAKVSIPEPAITPEAKAMPVETKSYSYYSNKISGRNIFSGSSYAQTLSQMSETEPSGGNLALVGIIPGNNPQAIIEDKKNQKTYYLVKGQSISEITLEDISEDKVVLEYKGKSMTLFL